MRTFGAMVAAIILVLSFGAYLETGSVWKAMVMAAVLTAYFAFMAFLVWMVKS